MYKCILSILFCLWLGFGTLWSQTIESLQFEIDNLRNQIILVIEDNNRSLVVVDSELAVAKFRIHELENENKFLLERQKELAEEKNRSKKTGDVAEENEELRQQLFSNRQTAQRNVQQSMIQMQIKEEENRRLTRRFDSLLLEFTKTQQSLAAANEKTLQLKVENETLWEQLSLASNSGGATAAAKPSSQGAAVAKQNNEMLFLATQLEEARKLVEDAFEEREQALIENEKLTEKVDSLTRMTQAKASPWPQKPPIEYTQKIDSLKDENRILKESLNLAQRNQTVDINREKILEQREKALRETETRLEIREHLLTNRENDITIRQHELVTKEEKYQGLDEKEKRLKLIEQRLRDLLDGQSRGSN